MKTRLFFLSLFMMIVSIALAETKAASAPKPDIAFHCMQCCYQAVDDGGYGCTCYCGQFPPGGCTGNGCVCGYVSGCGHAMKAAKTDLTDPDKAALKRYMTHSVVHSSVVDAVLR